MSAAGSTRSSRVVEDWPAHFGAMGQDYERRAFTGATLERLARNEVDIVLSALGPGRGRRVLDVGAGTGRFSAALAHAGWQVTAFDGSQEMLACVHARVPSATLVHGRLGEPLPFSDGEFAAVVALRVVKYVPDLAAALGELSRVAAAGAPVVFDVANANSLARFGYHGSPMGFTTMPLLRAQSFAAGLDLRAMHDGPRLPHAIVARARSEAADAMIAAIERRLARVLGPGRGARSIIVSAQRPTTRLRLVHG